jgi:regulatory protein
LRSKPSEKQPDVLERGLRYLAYRPRSESEVRSYLRRLGGSPDAVEKALAKLRSLNYLNDKSFARQWALSRAQDRGYGPWRIEKELQTKGIAPPLAREITRETFAGQDETAFAKRLLDRRFKEQDLNEPKTLRRAAAYLQRSGYSAGVIFDLLKCSIDEDC